MKNLIKEMEVEVPSYSTLIKDAWAAWKTFPAYFWNARKEETIDLIRMTREWCMGAFKLLFCITLGLILWPLVLPYMIAHVGATRSSIQLENIRRSRQVKEWSDPSQGLEDKK